MLNDTKPDRHSAAFRLRVIEQRLSELDQQLDPYNEAIDGQYAVDPEVQLRFTLLPSQVRNLAVERRALRTEQGDLQRSLNIKPRMPRDDAAERARKQRRAAQLKLLQHELTERTRSTVAFINKLAAEGNHTQARVWRGTLAGIGEAICKELGIPLDLLSEVEVSNINDEQSHRETWNAV